MSLNLSYCDYIADLTKQALLKNDNMRLLQKVVGVKYDLDANGIFLSTKKTIEVIDVNKNVYRITIEDVQPVGTVGKKTKNAPVNEELENGTDKSV